MTWEQRRAQILATIKSKKGLKTGILKKSLDESRSTSDDEESEIEAIDDDIAKLQKNLDRVNEIIKDAAKAEKDATPAAGNNSEQSNASADGEPNPQKYGAAKVTDNLEKGIGFSLMVKASVVAAKAKGGVSTIDILKSWGAPQKVQDAIIQKATVGTTEAGNWGENLVDYENLSSEFIELVREKTVVDKLAGQMRSVPFNIKMPTQTSASVVGWVGEAQPKPATNPNFGTTKLGFSKVAGIVVLSDELVRFSNPKADRLVRDDLVESTAAFVDSEFFDPTKAEADESPASVLNDVTAIVPTGTDAASYDADLNSLITQVTDSGLGLEGAYWIMGETRAATMSGLRDALGRKYFEGMELSGQRNLKGLPVLTSGSVKDKIVLIIPSQILLADDDQLDFEVSTEATINFGTKTEPNLVHMYQENLSAIRAERFIRWKKRRAAAAGYIQYT